ncbi:AcrR family transcriptional regulator [Marisediminicola sp. UYEF4]|uniref:TetR/AcrR family transcriptional regulator n=1 Tax=Marisediminicola sp. UYEF4 TaxID=1756384 RepID=UPI0033960704
MTSTTPALDRRAALKARHREAILDAADALIRERGNSRFSVDELAERADVARRTVFNHFASLDDIVVTTCTRLLTGTAEQFRVLTGETLIIEGSRATLLPDLVAGISRIDLPSVISYLAGVLHDEGADGRSHAVMNDVFTRTTEQLSREMAARSAPAHQLEVEILVGSLMHGVSVIARHWVERTGGTVDADSRALWAELLDRLVTTLRSGHGTHP